MTAVNSHLATGNDGACVIDLRTHRLAISSRHGRTRDAEWRAAARQGASEDLAQEIGRLLDRVDACLDAIAADERRVGG